MRGPQPWDDDWFAALAGWAIVVMLVAVAAVAAYAYFTEPARAQSAPYVAPDGRTEAQLVAAHVLPDPTTTPCARTPEPAGCFNPAVTEATLQQTVCHHGWTATVRPPVAWTNALKAQRLPPGTKMGDFELDHLTAIEDSGAPASPDNLWNMAYADRYGARTKDRLETRVAHLVCTGKLSLYDARAALSPNWLIGYAKYVGPLPK